MRPEFSIEKIMNSFFKGKQNIANIAIIMLTVVIAFGIYQNQTKKIVSLQTKNEAEIKKNDALNEISGLEKKIKSYGRILSKKDAGSVTNRISDLAKASNLKIISIKPGVEEKQQFYIKLPFILVIGADSYHAIGKFISKIENHPDIYFVDAISIRLPRPIKMPGKESTPAAKPANKLTADLILSTVVFKD